MTSRPLHTVLVPGIACSARLYEKLMPYVWEYGAATLADTRRDHSIGAIAERLLADAPPRFALAGISMGGYVAFEVMRQAPERVLGLALISTSARSDTPEQQASRRQQIDLTRAGKFNVLIEAAFPLLVDPNHSDDARLAAFWSKMAHEIGPDAFCAQLEAVINRLDSRSLLPTIDCPTAVIHGAGDQLIPPDHAHETAAGISRATLMIINGGGHMVAQEQPAALCKAVGLFLTQITTQP
jgi:pimeloyl-ACP methyl ester carboxylesterase